MLEDLDFVYRHYREMLSSGRSSVSALNTVIRALKATHRYFAGDSMDHKIDDDSYNGKKGLYKNKYETCIICNHAISKHSFSFVSKVMFIPSSHMTANNFIYCFKKYYAKCVQLELQNNERIHKGRYASLDRKVLPQTYKV
jgi:hypothetical protein